MMLIIFGIQYPENHSFLMHAQFPTSPCGDHGTFSTNRLYHAIEVGNVSHMAGGEHKYHAIKQ